MKIEHLRIISGFSWAVGIVAAGPVSAKEVDRLAFGIETTAHLQTAPTVLGGAPDDSSTVVPWAQLSPFVDEAAAHLGVAFSSLQSEVILRAGYRWASGTLPAGSRIVGSAATTYDLAVVPIAIGWRGTYPTGRLRALLGVDLGLAVGSLDLALTSGEVITSGTLVRPEVRALIGGQARLVGFLGVRLFFWGRLSQTMVPARGPSFGMTAVGLSIGLYGETTLPDDEAPLTPVEPEDEEPLLSGDDERPDDY